MGLLKKLFGGEKIEREEKVLPWIPLNDLAQIDYIKKKSSIKTQVIFKHSTRCGISRMVIRNFESSFDIEGNQIDLYYLDLWTYRALSDEIANRFQVWHESPQLIIIKNGLVEVHASHGEINQIDLSRFS